MIFNVKLGDKFNNNNEEKIYAISYIMPLRIIWGDQSRAWNLYFI